MSAAPAPTGGEATAASPGRAAYLRTARSPGMVGLLVVLLAAAAVCARLGAWQLDRAELRGEAEAAEIAREREAAPPETFVDVLAPQTPLPADLVGARVEVTGEFEPGEVLVTGRALDGEVGVLVLAPLRVAGPDGGPGALLPVVRGWLPDAAAASGLAPAPAGEVEVVGYVQSGEAAGTVGGPAGPGDDAPADADLPVVDAISPAELVNRWGGPMYSAYLVLAQTDPPQDDALRVLPPPTVPGGELNVQNLGYALQWWVFGLFAVGLWLRVVRDRTRDAAEEAGGEDDGDAPVGSGPGGPASAVEHPVPRGAVRGPGG